GLPPPRLPPPPPASRAGQCTPRRPAPPDRGAGGTGGTEDSARGRAPSGPLGPADDRGGAARQHRSLHGWVLEIEGLSAGSGSARTEAETGQVEDYGGGHRSERFGDVPLSCNQICRIGMHLRPFLA